MNNLGGTYSSSIAAVFLMLAQYGCPTFSHNIQIQTYKEKSISMYLVRSRNKGHILKHQVRSFDSMTYEKTYSSSIQSASSLCLYSSALIKAIRTPSISSCFGISFSCMYTDSSQLTGSSLRGSISPRLPSLMIWGSNISFDQTTFRKL